MTSQKSASSNRPQEKLYPPARQAWRAVLALTLMSVSARMDRQVISLMVEPIKRDFDISDTQMGLLMGFGFILFYAVLGVPLGRLADAKSRKSIIAVSVFLWSLLTAVCGITRNYAQLFLARLGVGVGEAGLSPAAFSMISDYFPRGRRAIAMSVFRVGNFAGGGIALMAAGAITGLYAAEGAISLPLIGAIRPWQFVFLCLGLPGLLLLPLIYTIREPSRKEVLRHRSGEKKGQAVETSFRLFLSHLREHAPLFLRLYFGLSIMVMAINGVRSWSPAFLIRTYGWTEQQAGLTLGIIFAVFSTIGVISGGLLAERLHRRGYEDAYMRVGLITAVALLPCCLLFPLMQSAFFTLSLLVPTTFFASFQGGAISAAMHETVPNQMRAQASATHFLTANLIGVGLGPTTIGLITDYVFRDEGALRYSLAIFPPIALIAAIFLLGGGLKYFRKTRKQVQELSEVSAHNAQSEFTGR